MELQTFSFPTQIHFGPGARVRVSELLDQWGMERPLIVTDRQVAQLAIFSDLDERLRVAGLEVGVFADLDSNPTRAQVAEGSLALRTHHADAIVALGGGAALDVAKAIALMAHHPGELFDYCYGEEGARPVDQRIPLLIAVPTTAGTGSEVGRSAVIAEDVSHLKRLVFSPRLMPTAAVVDPELTLELPRHVTAATGMCALAHNVEAYLATGYNPLCDGIALEGVRLVARALARAVETPDDLSARGDMMSAALMGAAAFQKGLGISRSMAQALSAVCDLHHGLGVAILLPHALAFNAPVVEGRLGRLADATGVGGGASGFISWVQELGARVGIPERLGQVGVSERHLPPLARAAAADVCYALNPRPVTEGDFQRLFSEAL